ncbi:ABC transporter permease [Nocardioides acrostichi]|uniref:Autoinducer 2 import system permease protein LsrD n=1 Tax=Nocardioides acrostichi TaxID=2784339 RepID=A0A930UW60_9ACTN|nr:ABC transporter permease [Nocardioides acrostichi]MBF4160767.1 ABC transporter permease [Nocardioides acrostichi]
MSTETQAPVDGPRARTRTGGAEVFQRFALVGAFVVVLVVFAALRPDSYLSAGNVQNLLTAQSVTMLLAFAVMVPLATDEFDLSVGYHAGLAQVLIIGMQEKHGMSWPLAVVMILLVGAVVGLVNGVLVTRFGISSFIATLGSGMFLFGITNWFTGGEQIIGTKLTESFLSLTGAVGWLPWFAVLAVVVGVVLWVYLERTVSGRSLFVVGSSRRAAELTGVSVTRTVTTAFVVSGVLAALGGILLGANLRTGTASVGPEYLLPAFAGAMLGATSIKPGRFNVLGTAIAVLTLAFLFSGVQQLGAPFYVEYFFNGGILVVAVGLSVFAAKRHRERASRA